MRAPQLPFSEPFAWTETEARLTEAPGAWIPGDTQRWYEQRDEDGTLVRALRPPLILLDAPELPPADAFAGRCPGRYAVLLFQAGAAALGLFHDGALRDHKTMKRYVVRGKGRAQPTHLKTRGKSRFGSRLRLRNAQLLLDEVSGRLRRWWADDVVPRRLYLSCPVRLFADLCRTEPSPPVSADDPRCLRIPFHVHVPSHAELLRVHRSISRGRMWWSDDGTP